MTQAQDTPLALARDAAQYLRSQKEQFGPRGVPEAEQAFTRPALRLAAVDAPQHSAATGERAATGQGAKVAQVASASAGQAALASAGQVATHLRGAEGLAATRADIGDCTRCKLCHGRTHVVFGVGSPRARLMFVGEGPGRDEDLQGEPFVGEAGKLLTKMIGAMGLTRGEVYIANIVKCRPPKNRDPEPDEVAACEPFLLRQIEAVRPEVLVGLGRYAVQTLLRDASPISRQRGKWRSYDGIDLMPTFHPAYLLRNPAGKRQVWEDLQSVMQKLGLPLPGAGKKDSA